MFNHQISENVLIPAAIIGGIVICRFTTKASHDFMNWWHQLPAFDQPTKNRYHSLIQRYKEMAQTADIQSNLPIPAFWSIDEESRPGFKIEIDKCILNINEKIGELKKETSRSAYYMKSLLEKFNAFLDSIQKHNWLMDSITSSGMSRSGVEAMFLGEMMSWVMSAGFIFSLENGQDLKVFNARKEYCRQIANSIPVSKYLDQFRPSFKSFLEDIVDSMENISRFYKSQHDARELNDHLKSIESRMTILTSDIINILMSLNTHSDYKKNNFDLFMNPPSDNYPKINAMRNTGLGGWLYGAMNQINVTTSTFDAADQLTVEEIKHILACQHPHDFAFFLENSPLKDCHHELWGHRGFVMKQDESSQKAIEYNYNIREIIRSVAWLFFIKKITKKLKTLSSGYGLIWIYGSEEGKAILTESVNNIEWIMNEKIVTPLIILSDFYIKDGLSYCRKNKIDYAHDENFSFLSYIHNEIHHNHGILGCAGQVANIRVTLRNILVTADNSFDMKEKLRKEQELLILDLLETMKLRNYQYMDTPNYEKLNKALNECKTENAPQTFVDFKMREQPLNRVTVEFYVFKYAIEQLVHYKRVIEILNQKNTNGNSSISIVNQSYFEKKYSYNLSMSTIYQRFFLHHLDDVTTVYHLLFLTHPVVSFFSPECWHAAKKLKYPQEKLPYLRQIWLKINEVFKYLSELEKPPELIEIELIANLLKDKLRHFYKDNRDIPSILLGFEMLWNIQQTDHEIIVHLNNFALSLTQSALEVLVQNYMNKIQDLEQSLSHAQQKILTLTIENQALKEKVGQAELSGEPGAYGAPKSTGGEELANHKNPHPFFTNESHSIRTRIFNMRKLMNNK